MADAHLHPQRRAGHRRLRRRRPRAVGPPRPARRAPVRSTAAASACARRARSHVNGEAFNPCSVRVADIEPTDEIVTIEGLAGTVGADLHPMQQAWLDHDVAQCGFCQPGQIMAAVAMVQRGARRGPRRSPTPTSTPSATSAGAAPTCGSARRSAPAPPAWPDGATRDLAVLSRLRHGPVPACMTPVRFATVSDANDARERDGPRRQAMARSSSSIDPASRCRRSPHWWV